MHYSPINAITAASPASASPSSSSVSPSSHIYQSHHGQHHLSGNDHSIHSMGEQNELMATAAAVSHHMSSDGMNSGSPITFVTTKVEPCDDLSPTNSTTYTTLQTASTPGTQNTQNSHQNGGHHHHHYNTDHPMAGPTSNGTPKSGNGSNKRNGTTATKSSYNSHNKSGNGDHSRSSSSTGPSSNSGRVQQGGGKKTKGRVKIKMEFIDNKLRRYTTFSKRKTGIMKKAYELSTLTGTQVMLLVASETGHVYTFATRKLQPMITSDAGKALIQTCLNSPDPTGLINGNGGSGNNSGTTGPDVVTTNGHVSSLLGSSSSSSPSSNGVGPSSSSSSSMNNNHLSQNGDNHSELARLVMANGTGRGSISGCSTPNTVVDQRMSATGFEETDLSYSVSGEDCSPLNDKGIYSSCLTIGTGGIGNNSGSTNSGNIPMNGLVRNSKAANSTTSISTFGGGSNPFFINETPSLLQGSDDEDDDDEEEEDEDEDEEDEMDDGTDGLSPEEVTFLPGLNLDNDLSRLIISSNPILTNDPLMWAGESISSVGQSKQPTSNNSGFISDRTKLSLNLKLQKKQIQQRVQQPIQRTQLGTIGTNYNQSSFGQSQTKPDNGPDKSKTTNKSNTLNKSTRKQASTNKSKNLSTISAANNSGQQQQQQLGSTNNANNSQFVPFDPALFLDSCFNQSNMENGNSDSALLDSHHSLDHIMLNNGEISLLNQNNSNQPSGNVSATDPFNLMMMINNCTTTSTSQHGTTNPSTSNQFGSVSANVATRTTLNKVANSTSKLHNNQPRAQTANHQMLLPQQNASNSVNTSQYQYQYGQASYSQAPTTNTLTANALGGGGGGVCSSASSSFQCTGKSVTSTSNVNNSMFAQTLLNNQPSNMGNKQHIANISGHGCGNKQQTSSTSSASSSTHQAASIKAANLNAIINNLASATSSSLSPSTSSASNSQNNLVNNYLESLSTSTATSNSNNSSTPVSSNAANLNQIGVMAAAAQQLLSGNLILCTTPTSNISIGSSLEPNATLCNSTSRTTLNKSSNTQLFSLGTSAVSSSSSSSSSTSLTSTPLTSSTTTFILPANMNMVQNQPTQVSSQHNPNLIYNTFPSLAGRILYQSNGTSNNAATEGNNYPTLITTDGQQLILNVAAAAAAATGNGITQFMTSQIDDGNNRRRANNVKQDECFNEPIGNTFVPQTIDQQISIDSLLNGNVNSNNLQVQQSFVSNFHPITTMTNTVNNSQQYAISKSMSSTSGSKKQRTK